MSSHLAALLAPAAHDAATVAALDAHYAAAARARDAHRERLHARAAHASALRHYGYDSTRTDAAAARLHRLDADVERAEAALAAAPNPLA